jgi:hypothetical protein
MLHDITKNMRQRIWDEKHWTSKFDDCLSKCYMASLRVVYVNVTWYHKIYDMYWTSKLDNCLCKCNMQTERIWDEKHWTSNVDNCLCKCYIKTQRDFWMKSIEPASLMIVYVNVTWYHKKYEMICIAPSSLMIVYVNVTWYHKKHETENMRWKSLNQQVWWLFK